MRSWNTISSSNKTVRMLESLSLIFLFFLFYELYLNIIYLAVLYRLRPKQPHQQEIRVHKAMYVSELAKTCPQKNQHRPGSAGVLTNHLARILASHASTWHVGPLSAQNPQKKTALAKCPAIQSKSTLFCPENSSLAKWRSRRPSPNFWRLAASKRQCPGDIMYTVCMYHT